jgi:murein DD-endopeptidase MepM/ murein hydrolase activator NlpD
MPASALAALLALAALQAPPELTLAPAAARPGDAVLVRVTGAATQPHGTLAGRPLAFWAEGGAEWRALSALPIETAPGAVPARVEADGADLESTLAVVEPRFSSYAITLEQKYVEPPRAVQKRIAADHRAFVRAFSHAFEPPIFSEGFDWPRRAPTSGRFGDQRVLNGKRASVHYGLDITGPRGAPVQAAADGEVVTARDAYLSGNTVVIWHGGGIYTAYFHLDRITVAAGQRVQRGQEIGRLGSTGRATGPHLHWGVKVDGLYVDPESILDIDFAAGTAPPRRPGGTRPPASRPAAPKDE